MYITDETFRTMFIEVLKTQSKDDLIDIILKEVPDYRQEDIVKSIYNIKEEEWILYTQQLTCSVMYWSTLIK